MITRIYLGLVTALLLAGGAYLFMPSMFELNGQPLAVPAARADVRAIYGAVPLGLALYVLPAVFGRTSRRDTLRLCVLMFGVLGLGRFFAMLAEGGDQQFNYSATVMEAIFALVGLVLWLKEPARTPA